MYMLPEDNTVEFRILEKLLDLENLSTSYKLFWFAGILKKSNRVNKKCLSEE